LGLLEVSCPKSGGLFQDLECELHILAIAMQTFISILDEIAKIEDIVKRNDNLVSIITVLQDTIILFLYQMIEIWKNLKGCILS